MLVCYGSVVVGFALLLAPASASGEESEGLPRTLHSATAGRRAGFIDSAGNVAIPFRFDKARTFSEGLAPVLKRGKWGFVDEQGQMVVGTKYQRVGPFREGRALVMSQGLWGYIDNSGQEILKPQFRKAYSFSEGLALVYIDYRPVFVDRSGTVVLRPEATSVDVPGFSEGLAFAWPHGGYIDRTGKVVIRLKRSSTYVNKGRPFSEGLAAVFIDGKWGFIDKTGKTAIEPRFDQAHPFYEGFAGVSVRQKGKPHGWVKWHFIDHKGNALGGLELGYAWRFSEGLGSVVGVNGKWGFIDRTGTLVIEHQFDRVLTFSGGIARVRIGRTDAYIDRTGRIVWSADAKLLTRASDQDDHDEPALTTYCQLLNTGDIRGAQAYISYMTRAELIQGCLMTLEWATEDPKRLASADMPRWGVMAQTVIGPFFQTYARTFTANAEPIDPQPLHKIVLDRDLDGDFRLAVLRALDSQSIYTVSCEHLKEDVRAFTVVVANRKERADIRAAAAQTITSNLCRLCSRLRRECNLVQDRPDAAHADGRPRPDVADILARDPGQFSAAQKACWKRILTSAEEVAKAILSAHGKLSSRGAQSAMQTCLQDLYDHGLLAAGRLRAKVRRLLSTPDE